MENEGFNRIAGQPVGMENALRHAVARRACAATAPVPVAAPAGAGGWARAPFPTLPLLLVLAFCGAAANIPSMIVPDARMPDRAGHDVHEPVAEDRPRQFPEVHASRLPAPNEKPWQE